MLLVPTVSFSCWYKKGKDHILWSTLIELSPKLSYPANIGELLTELKTVTLIRIGIIRQSLLGALCCGER